MEILAAFARGAGQVWKNETAPDPAKAQFPQGTVSCKLLFTNAPLTQVPYLKEQLSVTRLFTAAAIRVREVCQRSPRGRGIGFPRRSAACRAAGA